jgi:hypothetical protein
VSILNSEFHHGLLVVYGAMVGFTPIILAALASRFFKPELLRPVSALPASA